MVLCTKNSKSGKTVRSLTLINLHGVDKLNLSPNGKVFMSSCNKNNDGYLANLKVAAPCPANWDDMVGTDRERFCSQCALNVINISSLSSQEAEALLALKAGGRVCVQFYQRRDGTIITDNCPVGLRKLRDKSRQILKFASGFLALLFTGQAALAQKDQQITGRTAGEAVPAEMIKGKVAVSPAVRDNEREAAVKTKLSCALKAGNQAAVARSRMDLACFYRDKQDFQKAEAQFKEAAALLRRQKTEKGLLANVLMNWAATARMQKKEDQALQLEGEARLNGAK